jgi:hypothetical protein
LASAPRSVEGGAPAHCAEKQAQRRVCFDVRRHAINQLIMKKSNIIFIKNQLRKVFPNKESFHLSIEKSFERDYFPFLYQSMIFYLIVRVDNYPYAHSPFK